MQIRGNSILEKFVSRKFRFPGNAVPGKKKFDSNALIQAGSRVFLENRFQAILEIQRNSVPRNFDQENSFRRNSVRKNLPEAFCWTR